MFPDVELVVCALATLVETGAQGLELCVFRRTHGEGEYEDLYSYSSERKAMVTLPGFANRVLKACGDEWKVCDERMPMPQPDFSSALEGVDQVWHDKMRQVIVKGGTVSIPGIFGFLGFASSILKAFPRSSLLDRGTPIGLVGVRDARAAIKVGRRLRTMLPDREVGIGGDTDSEDIVVATYEDIGKLYRHLVGVFIGDVSDVDMDTTIVEAVSGIRNAARWGAMVTPFGVASPGLVEEGLFGPLTATMTYREAVDAGVGEPVTVFWLPCPRPEAPLVSADEKVLEAIAHQNNRKFMDMLRDIVGSIKSPAAERSAVNKRK